MRITIVCVLFLFLCAIASAQAAHNVPATAQAATAFPIKVGSGALQSNSFYGLLGNGYIADNFMFFSSDYYQFQILAYGSSCQGGWPNMQLDIDGFPVTSNIVDSTSPMTVAHQAFVNAGQHQVAVEFTNDCFSSPEDRNLFVKSVTIVPDAPPVTLQAVNFTNRSAAGMQAASDYWVQLGVGSIDEFVTFAQAGYYQFQVTGYGQVCQGGWPVLELDIDGVSAGNATFNGSLVTNSLQAFVDVGTHDIGLKFTNDCFAPPEDRNLFLKTLTIIPDTVPINLQPANMAIKTSGGSLFGAGDYAQFTNGAVGDEVTFPSTGTYQFQVVAYGSVAANVWPVMALQIDNSTVASVSVNNASPATYNLSASVTGGTHQVVLAFTNDAFINGQDRNLFLRSMAITQPQAVVRSVPPTFFGMHVGHFDVKDSIHLNNATFGTFRLWDDYGHLDHMTTQWYFVNPAPATYDYSALDDWITWAHTAPNNYDLIYTFGHTPCWEVPGGVCKDNFENRVHNIADWDAFVTSLVQHASGKIKYYEVWNEANIQYMPLSGDVPLLTLAQHAYSIIKANDPQAIVLTPSSSTGSTFLSNYLATATAPGVAPSFDAIAFHGYAQGSPPEIIIGVVNGIRQSAINHGVGSDVMQDTEGSWGVETDLSDRDEQAAFLSRSYVLQASLNVDRFVWYGWNEDLSDGSASWGKIWMPGSTAAGTLLKGGIAFNTVSDWLLNAQITACGNPVDGVWSCNITRNTGKAAQILWTDSSDYLVYQVAPQFTQWRDLLNDTPMAVPAGFVILNHKPIMVEVP